MDDNIKAFGRKIRKRDVFTKFLDLYPALALADAKVSI